MIYPAVRNDGTVDVLFGCRVEVRLRLSSSCRTPDFPPRMRVYLKADLSFGRSLIYGSPSFSGRRIHIGTAATTGHLHSLSPPLGVGRYAVQD